MLNDIFLFLEYLYFLILLQWSYSGLSDLIPNIIKATKQKHTPKKPKKNPQNWASA